MSYRSPVGLAAAIVVGLAALARATDAQGASVSAVGLDAGHQLLAGTLLGASASVTIPLTDVLSMHVGAERVAGHDRRTGTPCVGLIQPGTCPPEPLRDNARLTTVAGGIGRSMINARRVTIDLHADLRVASARVDTRGLTTGGRRSADQWHFGAGVGVEAAWSPWARLPLALEAGVTVGSLVPIFPPQLVDGYAPFQDGFSVARARLGMAWRRGLR